ncbi:MAG TPA: alpha/beta fold hydrolase [Pyrinomonadaceae bacterium]|nr:alpha/beta fold hydrolase [Pyrinomonadaceae bacterium]
MDKWLVWPKLRGRAALRLFCFPYAGSGASIYRSWEDGLPPQVHLCRVQLPGREGRLGEEPFTSLAPLLQILLQAVDPFLDLPFAFFGHSMGALIAFELARQLRRHKNKQPIHLFMSGRGAPQLQAKYQAVLNESEEGLVKRLRRLRWTPREILKNRELMQLILPTLRADYAVCDSYVYQVEEPLDCPLSVFGGEQDDKVSYDDLSAWREQTSGAFSIHILSGNHFFLHQSRVSLLRAIGEELGTLSKDG